MVAQESALLLVPDVTKSVFFEIWYIAAPFCIRNLLLALVPICVVKMVSWITIKSDNKTFV